MKKPPKKHIIKVTVSGPPKIGKSTLLHAIMLALSEHGARWAIPKQGELPIRTKVAMVTILEKMAKQMRAGTLEVLLYEEDTPPRKPKVKREAASGY